MASLRAFSGGTEDCGPHRLHRRRWDAAVYCHPFSSKEEEEEEGRVREGEE